MMSLVVPGTLETIATFCFKKALSSDDLPALGLPTIATSIPLSKGITSFESLIIFFKLLMIWLILDFMSLIVICGTSSYSG